MTFAVMAMEDLELFETMSPCALAHGSTLVVVGAACSDLTPSSVG